MFKRYLGIKRCPKCRDIIPDYMPECDVCSRMRRIVARETATFAAPPLQSIAEKPCSLDDALRLHALGVQW